MGEQITAAEAVRRLDAIEAGDPEVSHSRADDVLYSLAPAEVQQAHDRVVDRERGQWWYA